VAHLTCPRQWGPVQVPPPYTLVSQTAPLRRTGQRAERGQLRFSSPSALAMQDEEGQSLQGFERVVRGGRAEGRDEVQALEVSELAQPNGRRAALRRLPHEQIGWTGAGRVQA
jgi:hypothetical protein